MSVTYRTTATEISIIIEMMLIDEAKEEVFQTEYTCEAMEYICILYSHLNNRKKRDKTYKKILVAEAVIDRIKRQITKEKNEDILKVLRSKLIEYNDKLEHLKIKNKELLDKFFGNSRRS